MKKSSFLILAASFFANYPNENEIHFTKDGQAFFGKNDATNHGNSLREKQSDEAEILSITREEALAESDSDASDAKEPLSKEDQLAAAQAKVTKAETAVADAKTAYDEAAAKLAEKPDNKTFQKSEASRMEKLEAAVKALETAQEELDALSAE